MCVARVLKLYNVSNFRLKPDIHHASEVENEQTRLLMPYTRLLGISAESC